MRPNGGCPSYNLFGSLGWEWLGLELADPFPQLGGWLVGQPLA